MILINFENMADEEEELYVSLAEKVSQHILLKEGCPYDCEITLSITDNEGIREVNRDFRDIDLPTDVLSFPNYAFETPSAFNELKGQEKEFDLFNPENGYFYLGDIMISKERAEEQAEEYGHAFTREIAFLIAHSMLHLLGYDHMTEEEASVMEQKQENYLNELGITR